MIAELGRAGRIAVAGALLGVAVGTAEAQEPMRPALPVTDSAALTDPRAAMLDARAADIAAQLRCPVCSGQSVLESNSAIAQEMQEVVRERLERGESEDAILAYFRGAYGDWIVLRPRPTGLNLLVYVLPVVALIGGGIVLFVVLRRWSSNPATTGRASADEGNAPEPDLSLEDEAWLRESIDGR